MRTCSIVFSAVSLAVLAAACNNDDPAAPDSLRPVVATAASASDKDGSFSYAVIGDMPYGQGKLDSLPMLISLINSDPAVSQVIHVGDIKAGSNTSCTNDYFNNIRRLFDTFQDALVYTPGDNEWTDCHAFSKNNGLFTPTERLQAVRSRFIPVPGRTLGMHPRQVFTQAADPANSQYVENVWWTQGNVVFAAANITGSFNDLAPWSSAPLPWLTTPADMPATWPDFPSQAAEFAARAQANTAWISQAFATATNRNARGVVLAFQADMWDPAEQVKNPATFAAGYDALVQQIGSLAAQFGRPVLILEGDSHVWRVDAPFTPGDPFYTLHANTPVAPNVTRLVVDGSASPTSYTRLSVNPATASQLFTLIRVPLVPGQ
ncbi:MAG: metallophosphoesterase [Gemmatimonadota bacterium]